MHYDLQHYNIDHYLCILNSSSSAISTLSPLEELRHFWNWKHPNFSSTRAKAQVLVWKSSTILCEMSENPQDSQSWTVKLVFLGRTSCVGQSSLWDFLYEEWYIGLGSSKCLPNVNTVCNWLNVETMISVYDSFWTNVISIDWDRVS